jgi:hypothetical protein
VIKAFESIAKETPALYKFIYEAAAYHSVFIVGGFLRSVANNENPRDLDLIFNMSNTALEKYIAGWELDYTTNKFNGFKVTFGNFVLDIWTSETNWAFKTGVVNIGDEYILSKVAQGTFFNYDSLVFDLKTQRVNVVLYNDCVRSETIDIIRKDTKYSQGNPGKIGNVARAFKIKRKSGFEFSENLCRYIFDEFTDLGLYEADQMVAYMHRFVSSKRSGKYSDLNDESTIRCYVNCILDTLRSHHRQDDRQLKLFHL